MSISDADGAYMNLIRQTKGNFATPGYLLEQATDNATATASGVQATGFPIVSQIIRFTVVATSGDAATLPVSVKGNVMTVINAGAASMSVFPAVGEFINALAVNTAFSVASGKTAMFTCAGVGTWHTILSA